MTAFAGFDRSDYPRQWIHDRRRRIGQPPRLHRPEHLPHHQLLRQRLRDVHDGHYGRYFIDGMRHRDAERRWIRSYPGAMMLRRFLLALFLVCASASAWAQGCGSNNPNCIVPTRPVGDSTNAAANTAWVGQNTPTFTSGVGIPQFNGVSAPTWIAPGTGVATALAQERRSQQRER